jgi:leucyl aminopeptidase (aminopeptidase T)
MRNKLQNTPVSVQLDSVVSVIERVVRVLAGVQTGESVLILTDNQQLNADPLPSRLLRELSEEAGAQVSVVVLPHRSYPNEPIPSSIIAALRNSDVVFANTSQGVWHNQEVIESFLEYGCRGMSLYQQDRDSLLARCITAVDYDELYRVTRRYAEVLSLGNEIHLTAPAGTDLKVSIAEMPRNVGAGWATVPSTIAGLPDGEAWGGVVAGTATGVISFDGSMHLLGRLDEPVNCYVAAGHVTRVEGGTPAQTLARLLDTVPNLSHVAELSIGTNPSCRLTGKLINEDKLGRGRVHVALGNDLIYGGQNQCNLHLDGVILHPTLRVDGRIIVKDGELLLLQDAGGRFASQPPENG